jgi:hypothetical protein
MADVTQADIDALQAIIGSGILTVEYAGPPARRVTYQNTEAMVRELGRMRAELATAAGTRQSFRLATTRKGI